jgi:deoxyguanosine kinase
MINFICVEGNIGSGKTSLAKKLAQHYSAALINEEFEQNPFLPLFYKDPARYAFPLEFSFLLDRARQLERRKAEMVGTMHVADYFLAKCLWFAKNNLSAAQFEEFSRSYGSIEQITPKPDLLVFLHLPSHLVIENIRKRGRAFEKEIDPDYLEGMNFVYKQQSSGIAGIRHVLNFNLVSNAAEAYEKVFTAVTEFVKDLPAEGQRIETTIAG